MGWLTRRACVAIRVAPPHRPQGLERLCDSWEPSRNLLGTFSRPHGPRGRDGQVAHAVGADAKQEVPDFLAAAAASAGKGKGKGGKGGRSWGGRGGGKGGGGKGKGGGKGGKGGGWRRW